MLAILRDPRSASRDNEVNFRSTNIPWVSENECSLALSGKNKRQLKDSEAVLMVLVHSVTKDTVALEADTVELFLSRGRVAEVLVDMGILEAEKMD